MALELWWRRLLNRLAKFSWGVLALNLAVILWGAYVRATKSGAGCGSHWPLCNGEVIPLAPRLETVVEFTHRLSSGLALLLVVILFVWAFRSYPKGHPVRLGAGLALLFIVIEALVGAGLVLFEWVAEDDSLGRVISVPVHLANTFLLLGAITLTAWWAGGGRRLQLRGRGLLLGALAVGFAGVLIIGMTGAIIALGDTLYPPESLGHALEQDFSTSAPFPVRLRLWHPTIAILVGFYLFFLAGLLAMLRPDPHIRRPALALVALFVVQLLAGLVNVLLLAPVWMQLVHLLLADLVWIFLVLLSAETLSREQTKVSVPSPSETVQEAGSTG
jgi:heme A synthase